MRTFKYTQHQYDRAAAMRAEGCSVATVAEATGLSRTACVWYFRQIGLRLTAEQVAATRKVRSSDQVHEVLSRRRLGQSAVTIGEALGLTKSAVYNVLSKSTVRLTASQRRALYAQRKTRHDYPKLVALRRQGASIQDISLLTGISPHTLQSELPRRGARMMERRTWSAFKEAIGVLRFSSLESLPDGLMTCREVALICFCGRHFTLTRPHDVFYGRVTSCGCVKSRIEGLLADYTAALGVSVLRNRRTLLGEGLEIDVFVPEHRFGIEHCGLYWHKETKERKFDYHLNKLLLAQAAGIRLVQVFESEWTQRPQVVKAYIASILGRSVETRGARTLVLEYGASWQDVTRFLDEHHVQGATTAGRYVAVLRDGQQIVAALVCRLAPPRHASPKTPRWELTRYCVRSGLRIAGGFQRLWQGFLRRHAPTEVVSFSDKRWSVGDLYRRAGFTHDGATPPNYWYFKRNDASRQLYHKSSFKRCNIESKLGPILSGETERAAMARFNYHRIWDCGLDRWVWRSS